MEIFTLDTIDQILLALTGGLFLIQVLYYFCLYNRIYRRHRAVKRGNAHFTQELPPLSVIICAREEIENLRNNLPSILEQDYPQFEVIVITDGGTDESEDYLTLLEEKYPNLYHSFVPSSSRYISRKKLAVTLGIKASKHDWLVLTEADCQPQSDQWLRTMARNFTSQTQVVLGYSAYNYAKGWLNMRVSFDNLLLSMRYLGFSLAGSPYMGIGRNLAYRKKLFYQQKGFSSYLNLQRGDDDLFINQVANSNNTRVETDANAVIRTQPLLNAKSWQEEKVGYTSTSCLYHGAQRWFAGFETFSRLAFYGCLIAALIIGIVHFHWLVAGIAIFSWILRFIMQIIIINKTAKVLGDKRRYYLSLPLFDLLQPMQSLRWKLNYIFRKRSIFLRK